MSTSLQLRLMAAMLAQARVPALVSALLAAAALLLLCLPMPGVPVAGVALLSLLAALAQAYYAVRIGFDRGVLQGLLVEHPDGATAPLDDALHALGLRQRPAVNRDWPARWQGMRGLLRAQLLWLFVQALLLGTTLWLRGQA